MPGSTYEQRRLSTLRELGLLEPESVPIFDEATQTAAHVLDARICILGLLDADRLWFKSAVGLSRIGLMNDLASSRQLPHHESFCTYVIDSQQVLMIPDAMADAAFAHSLLVQRYGIRSYLGVPLTASNGQCLGTLSVMGLTPRDFTDKEAEMLQLIARWSISEFERNRLLTHTQTSSQPSGGLPKPASSSTAALVNSTETQLENSVSAVKVRLISQMTQELCTPLTSILGMAKVLSQGIYGSLTEKQREYIDIIHNSGQYLSSLINEVMDLGTLDENVTALALSPIDIEMLCQQTIATLKQAAHRHNQQIQLTVEPGPRIWLLDKDKVRQMLYHLIFSVMELASPESIVRIHVSRRQNHLNLVVWTSHPWLGEGLPHMEAPAHQLLSQLAVANPGGGSDRSTLSGWGDDDWHENPSNLPTSANTVTPSKAETTRQQLGLTLSRQLADLHGGCITVQGSASEGYRYVIKLPYFGNKAGNDS
ncbi:GAF domain-containing sensor histidine kinase [Egbenema bharatensis]|uniref:GAF domain-containing sensor histidine kinase n=1 Tax=Egbenema bharatensis TaxID=3463334 RepID=UPI003A8B9A6E